MPATQRGHKHSRLDDCGDSESDQNFQTIDPLAARTACIDDDGFVVASDDESSCDEESDNASFETSEFDDSSIDAVEDAEDEDEEEDMEDNGAEKGKKRAVKRKRCRKPLDDGGHADNKHILNEKPRLCQEVKKTSQQSLGDSAHCWREERRETAGTACQR